MSPKMLDWRDETLLAELVALKKVNPSLKAMVSIGGRHAQGWWNSAMCCLSKPLPHWAAAAPLPALR